MQYDISKKIVKEIVKDKDKETGLSTKVFSYTRIEHILEIIRQGIENKMNDNSITTLTCLKEIKNELIRFKHQVGDYDYTKDEIKIFLSELKAVSPTKKLYLWELLVTIYHEYNHRLLWSKDQLEKNLDNFALILENLTIELTNIYELNHHDDFKEEIDADVYSLENATSFLKHYPNFYKDLQGYIENDRLKYQIQFVNYDVEQFLNYITKTIKCFMNKEELFKTGYPYEIIGLLYNKDGSYKDLSQLVKEEEWTSLDMEVQYTIIASKSYQSELDYSNLSLDELIFIKESLIFVYQKELKRFEQNRILREQIIDFNKTTLPLLEYGENHLLRLTKKEKRNHLKIKYLENQLKLLDNLLQTHQNYHKKSRIHKDLIAI